MIKTEKLGVAEPRVGAVLYHGTSASQLPRILATGLRPKAMGGGQSPHRTKTSGATFLVNSIEGALLYAVQTAAHRENDEPVILAINPEGLDLWPDYDDVSDLVSVDLEELGRLVPGLEPEVGMTVPEELIEDVEDAIQSLADHDRAMPMTLSVDDDKLVVTPFVMTDVAANPSPELLEFEDGDIVYDDGTPRLLIEQFQYRAVLPPERIVNVYTAEQTPVGKMVAIKDYRNIVQGPDGDEWNTVPMTRLTLAEARQQFSTPSDKDRGPALGAGILFLDVETGTVLLLKRALGTDDAGTWSIPGGSINHGEHPLAAARREVAEEVGYSGPVPVSGSFEHNGFTTFVVPVHGFKPRLNWESTEYRWVPVVSVTKATEQPVHKLPLHPAFKLAWVEGLHDVVTPHLERHAHHAPKPRAVTEFSNASEKCPCTAWMEVPRA